MPGKGTVAHFSFVSRSRLSSNRQILLVALPVVLGCMLWLASSSSSRQGGGIGRFLPALHPSLSALKNMFISSTTSTTLPSTKTTPAANIDRVMPRLGLGTYLLERDQVEATISNAIRLGYRRIDCAPVYFNEDVIGDTLHTLFTTSTTTTTTTAADADANANANAEDSAANATTTTASMMRIQRKDVFIVSKLASPFHRKEHVREALEKTLRDLRLDYLDLYLIHWPVAFKYVPIPMDPVLRGWSNQDIDDSGEGGMNLDLGVSIHETWRALEACVHAGLVKYIGVSNFPIVLLRELLTHAQIRPAVQQVESHPYWPQSHMLAFCQSQGIHFQAYAPLGSPGYKDRTEPNVLEDPVLQNIAASSHLHSSISTAHVCLAWALSRTSTSTSVVVKSTQLSHLRDNWNAAHNVQLTSEDMNAIDSIPIRHKFFRPEDWWGSAGAIFD